MNLKPDISGIDIGVAFVPYFSGGSGMFLPTTSEEIRSLGWERLDVVLVTGDSYIDAPHIGVAVIGKVLVAAGFRVGIIAQPDMTSDRDIRRLGEPLLFWGVTAGCMDSMVANYTALNKRRRSDDLTAGGLNVKRPDRATIAYANLIRRWFKNTRPIVIGGLEASLRRISHYDYPSNAVRRSIIVDARANVLVYGMAERTIVELAQCFAAQRPFTNLRGICYLTDTPPKDYIRLPSHDEVVKDHNSFLEMFRVFSENSEDSDGRGLIQRQDTRYLVQNPPQLPLSVKEFDRINALDFERDVHPYYRSHGQVRCLETIRFSIVTHQGCFGGCRFCAIAVHQGRRVVNRSESSILEEAKKLSRHPGFKGYIQDVGGPTANMYGMSCTRPKDKGICRKRTCLFPSVCRNLDVSHKSQIELLQKIRRLQGIRKVSIGSGIRHDLILADKKFGDRYLQEIVKHHISGQLKIAPEHAAEKVLKLMGKPGMQAFVEFKKRFNQLCRKYQLRQYLTCYFIAAHPGCTQKDMDLLKRFVERELKFRPEQVQIFTPTPGTWSTTMYYTGMTPDSSASIFVERNLRGKERQKATLVPGKTRNHAISGKEKRRGKR